MSNLVQREPWDARMAAGSLHPAQSKLTIVFLASLLFVGWNYPANAQSFDDELVHAYTH
jgi:hypothetical protein